MDELARRFSLDGVGHSAGVFDEEKLAWVNRHYLKIADPVRLAELVLPYFHEAGRCHDAGYDAALDFLASAMPMASASVDRLSRSRRDSRSCSTTTRGGAAGRERFCAEMGGDGARAVVAALAEELAAAPRLDRERFRAVANRVKARTGQKGKALFHPIRVVLTGRAEGPELDLAVPAIDRGAELPGSAGVPPITGCRERAAAFAACWSEKLRLARLDASC